MEQLLQTILEEVKGVKKEIQETKQELHEEIQETKQEIHEEIQETKQELLGEMDIRFTKQSKEIAQELQQIMIFQERRNKEFHERLIKLEYAQG